MITEFLQALKGMIKNDKDCCVFLVAQAVLLDGSH